MSKKRSVKKNFFYQFGYQVLISLLPFVTSPYIARVLGAEQIGIYSYAFSTVTFFILFANLGIANYGNRIVAQNRDNKKKLNKEFSSLFYLHTLLSIVVMLFYVIYVLLFIETNKIIAIIQMIFIIANLIDISWLFFGEEDFKSPTIRNAIIKILNCALIFVLVKKQQDLYIYTLIMAIGTLCSQIILWPFAFKYVKLVKTSFKEIFKHTKKMLALFGAALAIAIYSYMDKLMLGKMNMLDQLGYYENGWKLIEFPCGFIMALGTVMLPKMTDLITKNKDKEVKRYIEKSMYISMIAASAISFGIAAIAKEFSTIFWGKEFIESGYIIMIMSVCITLMSWNGVIRSQYLIPKERDKEYLIAVILASVVNLIANFMLIPKLGAKGAALGTVLSYFTIFVLQNRVVSKEIPILKYLFNCIPFFIIGLIMFAIISVLNLTIEYSILGLIIKIVTGGLIYTLLLSIYTIISKNEIIKELVLNTISKIHKKKEEYDKE